VRAWIAIAILSGATFVFGRASWNIYQKNRQAELSKEATLRTLSDLKQREAETRAKLDRLVTEQGVEEEIRKALPVAKEGEHVIMIVEGQKATEAPAAVSATDTKSGFWASVIRAF
jgi:cell division protein FtsB